MELTPKNYFPLKTLKKGLKSSNLFGKPLERATLLTVLNSLSFTLLPFVMCFPLLGRFPNQTMPEFLMLKEKSDSGGF